MFINLIIFVLDSTYYKHLTL